MPDGSENSQKQKKKKKGSGNWIVKIVLWAFTLSILMSVASNRLLDGVNVFVAVAILLAFILVGILFDIIGMSVASASETPFHSMAAKKVEASIEALKLIRNSEKVSNFCNDVIGDICGIISGSTGAVLAAQIVSGRAGTIGAVVGVVVTACIAAITIGGKAFGKTLATKNCNEIIYLVAQIICFFKRPFEKKKG